MIRLKFIGTFLCLLLCACSHANAETYSVKFRVIDQDGDPIAGAQLATRWIEDETLEKKGLQPYFDSQGTTDDDGITEIVFQQSNIVLLGYTEDQKQGGYVVVEKQDEGNVVEIKFGPIAIVSAELTCSETDSVPAWTNTLVMVEDVRPYFLEFRTKDGKLNFPLPRGKWKLQIYGSNIKKVVKEIESKVETPEWNLGLIDFEATAMAKLIGKPAPLIEIADARGVPKDFQLADYKGKWVIIEFWGYW